MQGGYGDHGVVDATGGKDGADKDAHNNGVIANGGLDDDKFR